MVCTAARMEAVDVMSRARGWMVVDGYLVWSWSAAAVLEARERAPRRWMSWAVEAWSVGKCLGERKGVGERSVRVRSTSAVRMARPMPRFAPVMRITRGLVVIVIAEQ